MKSLPVTDADDKDIRALIRLLSDDDDRIVKTISAKLVEAGCAAIPLLQEAEIEQPEMAARIASVLDDIRGGGIERELEELLQADPDHVDLERGAFLLARYAYPELDEGRYVQKLDEMAGEARHRIGSRQGDEEIVKALGRYLFVEQAFKGNTRNYYDADNTYLHRVIERRTGIPISLSTLYLLIGKRLGLPVFGIGMPGHFLVRYESERYQVFIDCFNAGAFLTERDCGRFLTQAGYGFDEQYLSKSTNRAILLRSLRNLVPIYHKQNDRVREARLSRFIRLLECGHTDGPG